MENNINHNFEQSIQFSISVNIYMDILMHYEELSNQIDTDKLQHTTVHKLLLSLSLIQIPKQNENSN